MMEYGGHSYTYRIYFAKKLFIVSVPCQAQISANLILAFLVGVTYAD